MNYSISILFRAIPLIMALFCFGYGSFIIGNSADEARFVAGPVIVSLGMICIALFATAATIIRQIIRTYNLIVQYALPILGYGVAAATFFSGWLYMNQGYDANHLIAGHVICGVSFVTACVATTATASTRFSFIPENSKRTDRETPEGAFSSKQGNILIGVALFFAIMSWIWTFWLLDSDIDPDAGYIAGHVSAGLACICTSLFALVTTIVRQVQNRYSETERNRWPALVLSMGTLAMVWGFFVLGNGHPALSSTGYIMIGLGLVCFSISSKVILLSAIWRRTFALANRIPLIPVCTALLCLFLSAFLFEAATVQENLYVPARVLAGLGGICFTLFSIVSILESGTSK